MFLVDTNIFLEILLNQERREECKRFLDGNVGGLGVTDFSLHSLGIILFRYGKEEVYRRFVEDVAANARVLSLPVELYGGVDARRR